MTPQSAMAMVRRFTDKYGVRITWQQMMRTENSRGIEIFEPSGSVQSAIVLILKEKFTVITSIEVSIGLSQDYTRYVLALPSVDLKKDMVITDSHGMKWKLGTVDWFDVGGVPVAKQAQLMGVI